jgi:uncharacterized membrane protein
MPRVRKVLRAILAAFVGVVGVLHFLKPETFVAIMPRGLPAPHFLVYLSGLCEIAGAVGLMIPKTRRAASIGLMALLIAVFPANINMAVNHIQLPGMPEQSEFMLWLRLAFQPLYIYLAWWVGKSDAPAVSPVA